MTFFKPRATALALSLSLLTLCTSALAAPMEISGVKLEDPSTVRGTPLQLNGAGIRYKAIFKVYVAALYLGKKAATADEVFAATGPRRISVTMLRDIDSNELGKAFTKGFEDNEPKSEIAKLIPSLVRMGQVFADQKKLVAGDNFVIDYVPGTGTILTVKGVPQGEPFKEPEFFNALTRIWLGPNPADSKLKDALLGKTS